MCELRNTLWEAIAEEEYGALWDGLMTVFGDRNMNMQTNSYSNENTEHFHRSGDPWTHIYKVKFEEVPELVRGRQVLLRGGDAYVLSRDLDTVVSCSYSKRLSD